jgi:hypothetical protein
MTEARFWELYWGELAFVETQQVADLMVTFCLKHFASDESKLAKCRTRGSRDLHSPPTLEAPQSTCRKKRARKSGTDGKSRQRSGFVGFSVNERDRTDPNISSTHAVAKC